MARPFSHGAGLHVPGLHDAHVSHGAHDVVHDGHGSPDVVRDGHGDHVHAVHEDVPLPLVAAGASSDAVAAGDDADDEVVVAADFGIGGTPSEECGAAWASVPKRSVVSGPAGGLGVGR